MLHNKYAFVVEPVSAISPSIFFAPSCGQQGWRKAHKLVAMTGLAFVTSTGLYKMTPSIQKKRTHQGDIFLKKDILVLFSVWKPKKDVQNIYRTVYNRL